MKPFSYWLSSPQFVRNRFVLCLGMVLASGQQATSQEEPVSALSPWNVGPLASQPGDWLVCFSEERPLQLELVLRIDGLTLRNRWIQRVEQIFRHLDRDGDGAIPVDVARRSLPNRADLLNLGFPVRRNDEPPLDVNGDGFVQRLELAEYLLVLGLRPFGLGTVSLLEPSAVEATSTRSLFARLDRDQSGTLSVDEIVPGYQTLRQLDLDEDETITADELNSLVPPRGSPSLAPRRPVRQVSSPFLALTDQSLAEAAQQVITRYDQHRTLENGAQRVGRDGRLTSGEFGRDREFLTYDRNEDGFLVVEELVSFLREAPADAQIRVHWNSARQTSEVTAGRLADFGEIAPAGPNRARWMVEGITWVFTFSPVRDDPEEASRTLFQQLDLDGNDYLEAAEFRGPLTSSLPFSDVDATADGKVYWEEWHAVMTPRVMVHSLPLRLSVRQEGRQLFEVLDGNRDGRLTLREFHQAAQNFPIWDLNQDGQLALSELPQVWRLEATLGLFANFRQNNLMASELAGTAPETPVWFLQMDRNRDGDISPGEFLGTVIRFQVIDKNRDGLISPAEAAMVR